MKTISKALLLALVIQFTLFLPFEIILVTSQVVQAKDPGPRQPIDPTISFVSNSDAQQVITLKVSGSSDWTLTFQDEALGVSDFYDNLLNDGQLPQLKPGRPVNDSDIIRKYKITSPGGVNCFLKDYMIVRNNKIDYESDIYLITVKYTGGPDAFLQSGMYRKSQINQKLVKLVNSDMNNNNGFCRNLSAQQKQIINLTRSGNYINVPIKLEISKDERESLCNNLQMRWNNLVDKMRKLMIPAPSAESGTASTGNKYWVKKDAVSVKWGDFLRWVTSAFGTAGYGKVFDETYNYSLELSLTDEGKALYDEIADDTETIKKNIDQLQETYKNDSWPSGCARIKEFKWSDTAPAGDYASLDAFNNDFDKIYEQFKGYIEDRKEPISTGEEDACGNTGVNLVSGKIFQWLFCELANIIHGIAANIMTRATKWLTDSVGVNVDIKFKDPKEDKNFTGGGGANTTAPDDGANTTAPDDGANTTAPNGRTSTPRTAAPMNISGKINFNEPNEFASARSNKKINFKVKNSDNGGKIIDVADNCTWHLYDGRGGKGYADCKFTTKEKIPADWDTITLYGVDNNEKVLVRIMMQYPPDPANFVISNIFAN